MPIVAFVPAKIVQIQEKQGWNDLSMYGLALDFIRKQGTMDDFVKFLQETQQTENQMNQDSSTDNS